MNSYERVMAAMALKEPDRVPIAELAVMPQVYKVLMPEATCESDFHAKYLDVVCTKNYYKNIKEWDGFVVDEWGITYNVSEEEGNHPAVPAFSIDDDFMSYPLPDPYAPHRFASLDDNVRKYKGKKAIAWAQRACFLWAVALIGFEEVLVNFKLEPERMHMLLDRILEYNITMAKKAVEKGAEIVFETDDYAYNSGPLFSPEIFDEFLYPRLKRFVDEVHAAGAYVIKHTDGNIMSLLPGIVKAGVDGIHSIDPLAGMDMAEVKALYGDKISLWGNIEPGNLLGRGTPDEVRASVRECIDKGKKGGGLIVATSNMIMSTVRPENYKAMIETVYEYGVY